VNTLSSEAVLRHCYLKTI